MDYLLAESDEVLGYYANEPGLKVRQNPDANSPVVGSVRGDLFEIKLTGKHYNQWGEVKIINYREHPCSTELDEKNNLEFSYKGWLKILDENGEPNVWNYTKGC